MSSSTEIIVRIVADNDPRNGTIARRIVRMLEDDDRQPDADGTYRDASTGERLDTGDRPEFAEPGKGGIPNEPKECDKCHGEGRMPLPSLGKPLSHECPYCADSGSEPQS